MTYIVETGDTIMSIAKKFNVNEADLIKENNLENIYYLMPGIELIIPTTSDNSLFEYYIVKKDDNLNQVAQKLNISNETIDSYNKEIYLLPEQLIAYVK